MNEYHKIQTLFKRESTKAGRIILGEYSLPEFGYLRHNQWVWTEKVDGTNVRVMWDGTQVTVGGKTNNAQMPVRLMDRLRALFFERTADFADQFPADEQGIARVCLYGEGYGATIQKGAETIGPPVDFVLFDVKVGEWWLQRDAIEAIAARFGIDVVPIIGTGTLDTAVDVVRRGFQSQWGAFLAEGIVLRPTPDLRTRKGDRIIAKLKHRDFHKEVTDAS